MSSKIDERIVGMKFNNDQFQKGVGDTVSALDKLKSALKLDGMAKGLNDVDAAAKNMSLANIASGVEAIGSKFSAMSVIAITALANIASKAVDVGLQMAKSLTIDPIKAGLAEYELKMGSIQTILSNTARYGTNLGQVTGALDELNAYADKTIYNFGDMTKNVGLFTNAGMRVEDATTMIKGFSNEAAASGTNSQGAASAAYQLSQALSAGTIRLMDWRSLQNVGMGNKNMQNGLIEIADAMGTLEANTTSAEEVSSNFNGSLEKNWLSADVMSNYLKIMATDTYDAAKAQALSLGLSEQQADVMAKQAVTSNEAATKVRTYTQLVGTMQEAVGSGWSETFDILIGDFEQATELWTNVNNTMSAIIGDQAKARNDLLRAFAEQGGRDALISSVGNVWRALMAIIKPIKEAFQEIFPPVTAENLVKMAEAVRSFTFALMPSPAVLNDLKSTAKGVFAVLDIGRMIIVEVVKMFVRLFSGSEEVGGGILDVTGKIGDFLVKVRDAIKDGTGLEKFFRTLGDIIAWPIQQLAELGKWTVSLFSIEGFVEKWEAVVDVFKKLGDVLKPVGKWLSEAFTNVKDAVKGFFETLDFNVLVGLLNVGALAGIGVGLKKAFDFFNGKGIMGLLFGGDGEKKGPGIKDMIKDVFGQLTTTFGELQNTLKAGSLMAIAVAIALLTASVVALSFVDTDKLFISLGAMTVMFGQLSAMIIAIDKLTSTVKTGKMIGTAIALGILAGAMILMSTAILILSTMDWVELARGLAGMAVGLGLLVGASKLLGKMSGRLIFAAPAILIIATAMLILSAALKVFATMSWEDMLKGASMLAAVLLILSGAMMLMKSKVFAAASMVIIAVAINILAGAMKVFSTMSWDDILRSMAMFAAAMGIMAVGMAIMGGLGLNGLLGAAAMVVAAAAITILAGALKIMATMSWDEIGRSMVVLAGGLIILAAAMAVMGIPLVALGAAALFVAAAGIMVLAPALTILGAMSWDAIGRGMAVLAASLGILAVGGLLLIPASVGFFLLGAAILLIGTGVYLAGAGLLFMATGLVALAGAAAVGSEALKLLVTTMIDLIPTAMAAFAQGIIDFALVIAGGATEFTAAMSTLIQSLLEAIKTNGPLVIETIWVLVKALVDKVVEGVPYFVEAGMKLIIGVLDGIARNIGQMVTSATNVIVAFINGISANLPRIIQAGINLIINFVNGIADGIRRNTRAMEDAGKNLASAIIDGMVGGIGRGVTSVINAAKKMAESALNAAKNFLGINSPSKEFAKIGMGIDEGMEVGIDKYGYLVDRSVEKMGNNAINAMTDTLSDLKNAVATNIDTDITIKPILDLSAIRQGNGLIGGLLTPPSLKVDNSYAYASSIATAQRTFEEGSGEEGDGPTFGNTYNFTQNNTSPKALPPAELYRQGSNLLSVIKKGQPTNNA